MDVFKARARGLAGGLEPELSVVVDVMFPTRVLTCAVAAFQAEFPSTPLRISVEGLGAVLEPVLDRRCAFGVRGSVPISPPEFTSEHLLGIRFQMVASPRHPLAVHSGPIPTSTLARHVQLVLSDRSRLSEGKDFGVLSPRTWRLSDLGAKHAFLLAGLGWGGMPCDVIEADLASGALIPLALEDMDTSVKMAMSVIYRTDTPPGPAGRWLIDRLKRHSGDARIEDGPTFIP
jgi:DNA-binding transcriptional LysR family regulator